MNKMNKREFNRLAAEFLGGREGEHYFVQIIDDNGTGYREINPYDDANDMLLLEEKLSIDTEFLVDQCWLSSIHNGYISGSGATPHESRRACVEEYLTAVLCGIGA